MTNQRILVLPIHEPLKPGPCLFDPDQPAMMKGATLEFDLRKDAVKLPGGFVCSLTNLAHVVGEALIAKEKLECGRFNPLTGSPTSLKERGEKGPYL